MTYATGACLLLKLVSHQLKTAGVTKMHVDTDKDEQVPIVRWTSGRCAVFMFTSKCTT